jgi:hypothetical protein
MEQLQARNKGITIKSDRVSTLSIALLMSGCLLLLVRDIWNSPLLRSVGTTPKTYSMLTQVFFLIAATYCFFGFARVRSSMLRTGFFLFGMELVIAVALNHVHSLGRFDFFIAVVRSIVRQTAFAIFTIASVQWLRSAVRIGPEGIPD